MKLLVVAAEEREFRGILAHARGKLGGKRLAGESACPTLQGPRQRGGADARFSGPKRTFVCQPARMGVDWARLAALGEHHLLLVANGAGPARAAAAVDRTAAVFLPEAIVSIGFCGALDDKLGVAAVVVGTEVIGANGRFRAAAMAAGLPHHLGVVLTIDHVAQSAAEKRRLRQAGAIAVDMEAAAVAERSAALGLPFYCIKAVTDLAGEDMANDLNAALRPDGHFDTMKNLRFYFGSPAGPAAGVASAAESFCPGCVWHWGIFLQIADSESNAIPATMHAAVYRGQSLVEIEVGPHARNRAGRNPDSRGGVRHLPYRPEEDRAQPAGAAAHLRTRDRRRGGRGRIAPSSSSAPATAWWPSTTFPA